MRTWLSHVLGRLEQADIGGWCLLIAGVGVLGITLLLPAWHELQIMDAQQDRLNGELADLAHQHVNYTKLIQAVQHADPMLLERLAWHELNLKPADAEIFDTDAPATTSSAPAYQSWVNPQHDSPRVAPTTPPASVAWLVERRPALMALAIMLIGLGVISSLRSQDTASDKSAE